MSSNKNLMSLKISKNCEISYEKIYNEYGERLKVYIIHNDIKHEIDVHYQDKYYQNIKKFFDDTSKGFGFYSTPSDIDVGIDEDYLYIKTSINPGTLDRDLFSTIKLPLLN